ncbi:Multicopper oxidase, C-terminal [Dillenia turbinata]|uniref:Multicopper oxidase, C-terminal n=1 Tax=Dillenia turbinata TaxID=194707 RepID=A0AAN8ZCP7_9MAGN
MESVRGVYTMGRWTCIYDKSAQSNQEEVTHRFTIQDQEGKLCWHAHSSWLRATVYGALIIYPKSGSPYPHNKPMREIPILLGEWWDPNPIDVLRQATIKGAAPNVLNTNVLLSADQPLAEYYMAARAYASAQGAPFDNTTTTAIIQYKHSPYNTKKGTSSVPILRQLPAYNDTTTATAFTSRFKSPSKVKVPDKIDENLFFTISSGLFNCSRPSPRCQGPNGTHFTSSMNTVSFVLPSNNSILQACYQHTPGVDTTDFPTVPPVQFDYAGNVTRALRQPIRGTKLYKLNAQGFGNFDPRKDRAKFNLTDPPLRNTIDVTVGEWAVIHFVTNNPGVWLMHYHLNVHITWGLAMAFPVGVGEPQSTEPLQQICPSLLLASLVWTLE